MPGKGNAMHRIKPFLIIGAFWLALFLIVVANFSGNLGVSALTGYAVNENGTATPIGVQGIMLLVLFFTNIVTLYFLAREKLK